MKKKILITGNSGYIGSILCDYLSESFDIIKFDKKCSLDVLSKDVLSTAMKNCSLVVHLAALISVEESQNNPIAYYSNNICGTVNVLDAMKEVGCKKIIFISSCCVYKKQRFLASENEEDKIKGTSTYARTKTICEEIVNNVCRAENFGYVILRLSNVCGKNQNTSHILPSLIRVIKDVDKISKFKIYGTDYQTSDGTCVRNYIDVRDVVLAIKVCIDSLYKRKKMKKTYNVTSDRCLSILEVISEVCEASNYSLKDFMDNRTIKCDRRNGDDIFSSPSSDKIRKELCWKDEYTFRQTINSCLDELN